MVLKSTNKNTLLISTVNSRLANTPLLRTLAITDKIQIPGESYRSLTETDNCYYGLSFLRNYGHFSWYKHNNFIVLTLNKADTVNCTCNINCSLMFCHLSKHTSKDFWNVYFCTNLFCGCTTDCVFSLQLMPFPSRLFRRDQALILHSQ